MSLILTGLLVISCCILAACGNRGPLYLPDEAYVPATSQDSADQMPEPRPEGPAEEAAADTSPDPDTDPDADPDINLDSASE